MYEIVDMLDHLTHIHNYFYMKNLDLLLLDVGSIHFDVVKQFKLKIPYCICNGTIPDDHILD